MRKTAWFVILCLMIGLLMAGYAQAQEVTLTVTWAAWAPMDTLIALAEDFTTKTGIKVVGAPIPWPQYHDKVFTEFASGKTSFDIVLPDSQWVGEAVVGGHLLDITDWFNENVNKDDFYETFIKSFCEYPDGSGKYYGVPVLGDFFGMAYRTDLFNDPKEKEAFLKKYGYELKPPETWSQLKDIAEFFTRPEQNLYGVALWQAPIPTAGITDEFLACFWSFGGKLWDPETKRVKGILNNEAGKAAARYWVDLYKYCPPGSANYSMDEANTAMQQGLVAMMGTYLAFYPGLIDPDLSLYWDKIDFFPTPREKEWWVQLGGQGMAISAYTPHKKEALMFLEWWLSPETQWKWAEAGMFSCMKSIVEDDRYLEFAPVNKVARASYPHLRDYWEIPEYNEMGTVMAEILNAAVLGKYTPEEAMDLIAEKHEEILERAGYYKK